MNKIKQKSMILLLAFILSFFLIPVLNADMFPKPTTNITIIGVEEPYHFDVLFYNSMTPEILDLASDEVKDFMLYNYYEDYAIIPLNGYQDSEGFVSYSLYASMPNSVQLIETNENSSIFKLGYYSPPKTFKIVIYTDSGKLFISDQITTKYFHSEVTFDLSDIDQSVSTSNIRSFQVHQDKGIIFFNFLYRVVITILFELGLFWLFGYRKKSQYLIVIGFNAVTQSVLTLLMVLGYFYWGAEFGAVIFLFISELFVLITEIIGYLIAFKSEKKLKLIIYAILANGLTFLLSLLSIPLF